MLCVWKTDNLLWMTRRLEIYFAVTAKDGGDQRISGFNNEQMLGYLN